MRFKIFVLFLCFPVIIQGYATGFLLEPSLYLGSKSQLETKLGYERIFRDQRFKTLTLGVRSDHKETYLSSSLHYGFYRDLTAQTKTFYKLSVSSLFHGKESPQLFVGVGAGVLSRLTSRISVISSAFLPIGMRSLDTSVIVSCGVHYFYGSGIEYREKSKYIKRIKRRVLWLFWIDDE